MRQRIRVSVEKSVRYLQSLNRDMDYTWFFNVAERKHSSNKENTLSHINCENVTRHCLLLLIVNRVRIYAIYATIVAI